MPLTRLDYQPTDFLGGVADAGSRLAKTAESYSPAHPLIVQGLRRIYAGEDPSRVAAETKLAMQRQQPPSMPAASPGDVGMIGSMRSSMGDVSTPNGAFTGPREFSDTETVVGRSPPPQRSSQPLASEPATGGEFYSQAQPPILNKDLPVLMQGAGMMQKDRKGDLGELNYLLNVDRLRETTRNRLGMQPGRDARTDATRATTANMPFTNRQKESNTAARWAQVGVNQGNLGTRRVENYLKGAGPSLEVTTGLGNLIQQGIRNPDIMGTQSDYAQRRIADVVSNVPLFGKFAESALKAEADETLNFAQREFKRQLTAELSTFIHSRYGSALSGHELAQANIIAGGQLSLADTIAGAQIVYYIANRKAQMYQRAYPEAAEQVGKPSPGPNIPTEYPYNSPSSIFSGDDQGGVGNIDQPRLRGTITDEGVR